MRPIFSYRRANPAEHSHLVWIATGRHPPENRARRGVHRLVRDQQRGHNLTFLVWRRCWPNCDCQRLSIHYRAEEVPRHALEETGWQDGWIPVPARWGTASPSRNGPGVAARAVWRPPNRRRNAHSVVGALPRSDTTPFFSFGVTSSIESTSRHRKPSKNSKWKCNARFGTLRPRPVARSSEPEEEGSFVSGAERGDTSCTCYSWRLVPLMWWRVAVNKIASTRL